MGLTIHKIKPTEISATLWRCSPKSGHDTPPNPAGPQGFAISGDGLKGNMPCNKASISSGLTMAFGHDAVDGKGFESMVNPVINLGKFNKGSIHPPSLDFILVQLKMNHH